jgi:pimeloyl-ACP methyl ester carboxylesterase
MLRLTTVSVEGRSIRYATEGSGPPLLLIHGPPFDHRIWAPTIPYLVGHLRVLAPDMPSASDSPETQMRLLAGLLTTTHSVPCFAAGAGLGGALALALAARYPERVRAVILIGSSGAEPWPESGLLRLARSLRFVPGALALATRLFRRRLAARLVREMQNGSTLPAELPASIANALATTVSRRDLLKAWRGLDAWRGPARVFGGVRAPTLLLWGEHDRIYGLKSAERLRHIVPGAQLITFAGAGHLLTVERPVEVGAAIRHFLGPAIQAPAPRTIPPLREGHR